MAEATESNAERAGEHAQPSIEETAEEARALYQEIVDGMGVDAEVIVAAIEDDDVQLEAHGEEEQGGLLIGRRGQTLEAVQLLVGTILGRYTTRRVRVTLDAFGYRQRRIDALRGMAIDVADQVRSSGQEALTEPLNAAERRIIHTTLQDQEGITTYSEGEEPQRYVVISPSE